MNGTTFFKTLVGLAGIVACASACNDNDIAPQEQPSFPSSTVITDQTKPAMLQPVDEVISSQEYDAISAVHSIDATFTAPSIDAVVEPTLTNLDYESLQARREAFVHSEKRMHLLKSNVYVKLSVNALTPEELNAYIVDIVGLYEFDSKWASTIDSDKLEIASYILGALEMDGKTNLQKNKGLKQDYYTTRSTTLTAPQQKDITEFDELKSGLDAYLENAISKTKDKLLGQADFDSLVLQHFNSLETQVYLTGVEESRRTNLRGYLTSVLSEKYKKSILDLGDEVRYHAIQ